MINPDDFKTVMRDVVARQFPDEVDIFDLDAEAMIAELYSDGTIQQRVGGGGFRYEGSGKVVLEFVGLLAATFKALAKAFVAGREVIEPAIKLDDLRRDLEIELLRQGIKKTKVDAIITNVIARLGPKLRT